MKTFIFEKRNPMLARVGACLLALAGGLALGAGGCNEAGLGDRCNPLRSSNECGSGLVCAGNAIGQSASYVIPYCPENYCCPLNADGTLNLTNPGNPYCQPGCNGGAAALCAAGPADAEACTVSDCLADASDPSSCVASDDGGTDDGSTVTSDGSTDAPSDAPVSTSEASTSEAGASEGGTSGASEAGTSEAGAEAAAPPSDASADSATTD
jgi:hypothetical protein